VFSWAGMLRRNIGGPLALRIGARIGAARAHV
jgi:hypothetical protein